MKTWIITGAGHFPGIGACLAQHMLEQGNRVAINSRSFDPEWYQLKETYTQNLLMISGDITCKHTQTHLVEQTVTQWNSIDVLVNNASTVESAILPGREDWNQEYMMSVIVPYELSMLCKDHLAQNSGSVIMIGSRAALVVTSQPGACTNLSYGVAKSAQNHLVKSLAVIMSPHVRVNAIAPATFPSQRFDKKFADQSSQIQQQQKNNSLTGQLVDTAGLTSLLTMLAYNHNITGQIVPICNGSSIPRN